MVTQVITKGTKVEIRGDTNAMENAFREVVNRTIMVQRVMVVKQLRNMVKILKANVNLYKNIHLLVVSTPTGSNIFQWWIGSRHQCFKRINKGESPWFSPS